MNRTGFMAISNWIDRVTVWLCRAAYIRSTVTAIRERGPGDPIPRRVRGGRRGFAAARRRSQCPTATRRRSLTHSPSLSPGRARARVARSNRASASAPAYTPRSDTPIPTTARTAGDPTQPDRTAQAIAPRRLLLRAAGLQPANTNPRPRPVREPVGAWPGRVRARAGPAIEVLRSEVGAPHTTGLTQAAARTSRRRDR